MLEQYFSSYEIYIRDIIGDGNCLFRAVSDQLYGNSENHEIIRSYCMDYIEINKDKFSDFIHEYPNIDNYINNKRCLGVWGDNIELQALCELYNIPIHIFQIVDDMKLITNKQNYIKNNKDTRCNSMNYIIQSRNCFLQRIAIMTSSNTNDRKSYVKGLWPLRLLYYGDTHYDSLYFIPDGTPLVSNYHPRISYDPGIIEKHKIHEIRINRKYEKLTNNNKNEYTNFNQSPIKSKKFNQSYLDNKIINNDSNKLISDILSDNKKTLSKNLEDNLEDKTLYKYYNNIINNQNNNNGSYLYKISTIDTKKKDTELTCINNNRRQYNEDNYNKEEKDNLKYSNPNNIDKYTNLKRIVYQSFNLDIYNPPKTFDRNTLDDYKRNSNSNSNYLAISLNSSSIPITVISNILNSPDRLQYDWLFPDIETNIIIDCALNKKTQNDNKKDNTIFLIKHFDLNNIEYSKLDLNINNETDEDIFNEVGGLKDCEFIKCNDYIKDNIYNDGDNDDNNDNNNDNNNERESSLERYNLSPFEDNNQNNDKDDKFDIDSNKYIENKSLLKQDELIYKEEKLRGRQSSKKNGISREYFIFARSGPINKNIDQNIYKEENKCDYYIECYQDIDGEIFYETNDDEELIHKRKKRRNNIRKSSKREWDKIKKIIEEKEHR
ncbi:OTU-like cysteine protease family protein [Cryptosporidium muris RN66]|uniref:ubiquitinyl hydrolase 1 n=1 Tax=Cryptosporidium muris (strain RN66) TaxID=441375 RepID=B6ADC8_CRYMR|nr:OTU-like cysteine protease family protein [Cryptosporidium muris RN66]EEA06219.1 OTU-like cysteine protease family protein [Cryptosporidium muris RN66]|eukprot:XP_002140568.1 OTU-like cysteine protease family protein [Cryptosporidium muris RN66]